MVGCFYAVRDQDLEAIIQEPKRIKKLWGAPATEIKTPSFLGKLFGAKASAKEKNDTWEPSEKAEAFDVDKAWQGIHFLLTGSDWEGDGPLAFMLRGGRDIKEDLGYGTPHCFTSAEVKEISSALDRIDIADLHAKADPAEFAAKAIYPQIWKSEPKEECIGYVTENLKSLREFVRKTAESNRGLIVYLG